jgi:predicted ATPase
MLRFRAVLNEVDPFVGRVLDGKYRLEALLGVGAAGRVYRATQLNLRRHVAIKVLHPTDLADPSSAVDRFKREALGVARLRHLNIVTIFDFSTVDDIGPYLVFEYLRGRTLAQELEHEGPFEERDAIELIVQVCGALDAAHSAGVLHRDLKPQNLFVEETPGGRRLKILDFGLAVLKSSVLGSGWSDPAFVGTPLYVAPEQCEDQPASAASDVYALGCVLYEMLTGRPPITGQSVAAILLKKLTQVPVAPSKRSPELSARLDEVVLKALAIDPRERFGSAAELGVALAPPSPEASSPTNDEVRDEPGIRTNLPQSADSFVGRREYIAQFEGDLAEARLVTVAGPGGIGKTRLALEVARSRLDQFEDGTWFVDLAAVSDPALVPSVVMGVTRVQGSPERDALDVLCEGLKSKRVLVVLDNCEHLVDACVKVVDALLRQCRNVRILATSREVLGLPGEAVLHLGVLVTPTPEYVVSPSALVEFDSVRLFMDRVRRDEPRFELSESNAASVAALCHLLEGLPLAIELAAARVASLSVDGVLRNMHDRFHVLVAEDGAQSRRSALRATIDWSYDLLTEDEKILLRRLSVFVSGFSLEAAQSCCSGDGIDELAVLDLLTRLTDKSFVDTEEADDESRYRMLETIRQYAREKLRDAGEEERQLRAHRDWFLWVAETFWESIQGNKQKDLIYALINREHDNLRAALSWSIQRERDANSSVRIAGALCGFWNVRGHYQEGVRWLEQSLALDGRVDDAARALALHGLGLFRYIGNDYSGAVSVTEASVALRRKTGDLAGLCLSLDLLAMSLHESGEHDRAIATQEETLRRSRELGSPRQLGQAKLTLGLFALSRGDFARAAECFSESRLHYWESGSSMMEAVALHNLGMTTWIAGDAEGSAAHYVASQELAERVGYQRLLGDNFAMLGAIHGEFGRFDEAVELLERAASLYREIGFAEGYPWVLEGYAITLARAGRASLAVFFYEVATADRLRAGPGPSPSLRSAHLNRLGSAITALEEAAADDIRDAAAVADPEETVTLAVESGRALLTSAP